MFQSNFFQVQIDIIKQWIERRVIELMGIDDEFVYTYAQNQLEDMAAGRDKGEVLCPK